MISREQKKIFLTLGTVISIGLISFSTAIFVKNIRLSSLNAATSIDPTAELVDMSYCIDKTTYNYTRGDLTESKCYKISGTINPHVNPFTIPQGHQYDPWYSLASIPPHPLPAFVTDTYIYTPNASNVPYKSSSLSYAQQLPYESCRGVPSTWGCYYDPQHPDYWSFPAYPASELYKFQCTGTINFKYNDKGDKLKKTIDWSTNIADSPIKYTQVNYLWTGDATGSAATSPSNVAPGKTANAFVSVVAIDSTGKNITYNTSCSLYVPFKPKLSLTCNGTSTSAGSVDWNSKVKVVGGDPGHDYNVDLTWKDGIQGASENVKYPPGPEIKIITVQNSVSGNITHVTGDVKATSPVCTAEVCPIAVPYEKSDWEVSWFGGKQDIRINSKGCAMNRDEVHDTFSKNKDSSDPFYNSNLGCVKPPFGSLSGGGGYNERFRITGKLFRDYDSSNVIYAAYPINRNLPDENDIADYCGQISLKNKCMLVKAHEGDAGLTVPIWDRGADKDRLDLSQGALNALGLKSGDHIYDAKLVDCDDENSMSEDNSSQIDTKDPVTDARATSTPERRARYLNKPQRRNIN